MKEYDRPGEASPGGEPGTDKRERSLGHPPAWVADAIFYQIFPDRFARGRSAPDWPRLEPWEAPPTRGGFKGGDLDGITERLGWLEALGANAIWLNPIFSSASNHRYHAYDYLRVDPLLGGDAALGRLLDAAHARGMRVVLDGVFNHSGRGFWPFHHLLECGEASPWRDWFTVRSWPLHAYDERGRPGYEAWWGLRALPKLNVACPEAREYLLSVAEHWIRFGADGWRLDVPQEIDDPEFWREFRQRVRAIDPEAYLVGEIWDEAPEWLRGDRFDALMNYPLARRLLGFTITPWRRGLRHGSHRLRRASGREVLEEVEHQIALYGEQTVRSQLNLLGSHDTPRLRTLLGGDSRSHALAALLQFTLPGAPCIYYGDELALEGGADPECRGAFPREREAGDRETLEVYRRLGRLRRREPLLRRGRFTPLESRGRVVAFLREQEEGAGAGAGAESAAGAAAGGGGGAGTGTGTGGGAGAGAGAESAAAAGTAGGKLLLVVVNGGEKELERTFGIPGPPVAAEPPPQELWLAPGEAPPPRRLRGGRAIRLRVPARGGRVVRLARQG